MHSAARLWQAGFAEDNRTNGALALTTFSRGFLRSLLGLTAGNHGTGQPVGGMVGSCSH